MNNNSIDRIIFKNILDNKPIDNLIKLGLDYSFLADRYEEMLINKEAEIKDNKIMLTKIGEERLIKLEKDILGINYIEPLNAYRIEKMSKDEVFLP